MAWVVWAGQDQLGSSAKTPSALVLGLLSCSPLCCWASICPARSPPPRRRRCLGLGSEALFPSHQDSGPRRSHPLSWLKVSSRSLRADWGAHTMHCTCDVLLTGTLETYIMLFTDATLINLTTFKKFKKI